METSQDPLSVRETQLNAALQFFSLAVQSYDPNRPDHGRSGARNTLVAVIQLLAVLFPNTPALPIALQDLLQGLVDLDRGRVIPLLKPLKTGGAPPKALQEDLLRALPAAAMTCLMEGGQMARIDAAREVASRLSRLGYRLGRIPHGRIAKWREEMMRESARENLAVQRYQHALKAVKEMGMDATAAVSFLLGNLPLLYPAEFPKKGAS